MQATSTETGRYVMVLRQEKVPWWHREKNIKWMVASVVVPLTVAAIGLYPRRAEPPEPTAIPHLLPPVESPKREVLPPVVVPEVEPAQREVDPADLPPVLPDLTTGPIRIARCQRFCVGRPSRHSTISLALKNTSERAINVTRGVFNPEELYYASRPFPLRPQNCPSSDPFAYGLTVPFYFGRSKAGIPIEFTTSIAVPPYRERTISIELEFVDIPEKYQPYLKLMGTFTLFYDEGEASSEPIVVAGEPDLPPPLD
jgi:hypothetical protein